MRIHVVYKAAINPECVTVTIVYVVGILSVPAAVLRFKMKVP